MTGLKVDSNIDIEQNAETYFYKIFARTMLEISNEAKMNAPVDTGFLRNSIQLEVISDTTIYVTSYASYSYYIEYGTKYMIMQPFMRPAVAVVLNQKIKDIIQEAN
jgi:HK97 gp10 family phage protein